MNFIRKELLYSSRNYISEPVCIKKGSGIYLTDINIKCKFDFKNGLKEINNFDLSKPNCSLTSESLYQLFKSGYGYDALIIGGRFEANKLGLKNLNKIFKFQAKNYQNIFYNYQNIISNLIRKFFNRGSLFYSRDS